MRKRTPTKTRKSRSRKVMEKTKKTKKMLIQSRRARVLKLPPWPPSIGKLKDGRETTWFLASKRN